jgi:hypothetical protein
MEVKECGAEDGLFDNNLSSLPISLALISKRAELSLFLVGRQDYVWVLEIAYKHYFRVEVSSIHGIYSAKRKVGDI